ncbi:protein FRA10AC1 homolog [Halictus rubicundus]|uniref:protein FRA10AC1 homolog n=1 Tax=Halictus rubicundus TaxID=77578 RepID=UPI004036BA0F
MFPAYAYLSAYDRHKKLINDYLTLHGGSISSIKRDTSRDKTDYDVIKENHKFLWDQDNDEPDTWGARLAKKYYDKLFKEYCIADLSYYKQNKVALRWRTEKEVIVGKGQFECGNKRCNEKEDLKSWEVNFGYIEHGEKKNALVKLRLCPECSVKLNYRSQKREVKRHKALKRLGRNSESQSDVPSTSAVTIKIEETTNNATEESVAQTEKDESTIWKEKPADSSEKTREEEFEEYLTDLLM